MSVVRALACFSCDMFQVLPTRKGFLPLSVGVTNRVRERDDRNATNHPPSTTADKMDDSIGPESADATTVPTTNTSRAAAPPTDAPRRPRWTSTAVVVAILSLATIAVVAPVALRREISSVVSSGDGAARSASDRADLRARATSDGPSVGPSGSPSEGPSEGPSGVPSRVPSSVPSDLPSKVPSNLPSTSPSSLPSLRPTSVPSDEPTRSPSDVPSAAPSSSPSDLPSVDPSNAPSSPPSTSPPSHSPTEFRVPANPVPRDPPRGYFNYDPRDERYGPRAWKNVDASDHPLREFGPHGFGPWRGHLEDDPVTNRCGLKDRTQSPKDLRGTTPCLAWHEIRTRCGHFPVGDAHHVKRILPHKLSVVPARRPCLDLDDERCLKPRPPSADQPNYIGSVSSYSDLVSYDVKVPGEHTIRGERFDAEIQMTHVHPDKQRDNLVTVVGVVVRAREGGHNEAFERILSAFEEVYDDDAAACAGRRRRRRAQRRRTEDRRFDPYAPALMPSIYFYRYNGSLTEPPCRDVTWWVTSAPAVVSHEQLRRAKRLLFTHVDADCRRTSVHNENQSAARPTFPLGEGEQYAIQHCTEDDFVADVVKGTGRGRECR